MQKTDDMKRALCDGRVQPLFEELYGPRQAQRQAQRYLALLDRFAGSFAHEEAMMFSTPGRTEVGGNHTDHNAGRVLAASVGLDVLTLAAPNGEGVIRLRSEGYPDVTVALDTLEPVLAERYTSAALVRGVCARVRELGYKIGGFDAVSASTVLGGSGLSSSAAFEVNMVSVLNGLFNGGAIDDVCSAQIAQYAENVFFNKPCGLMDQTACAVGGFVSIDFNDPAHPLIEKVSFDFASAGHVMLITDTGGSHADLTEDYTALEHEMKAVAAVFGKDALRRIRKQDVLDNMAMLRQRVSDRAILRALHFFDDDARVPAMVQALRENRFETFKRLIIESGYSSWMLCQNNYSANRVEEQGISIACALSETLLKGKGAWRVHGGGFSGTIQAFVPESMAADYKKAMDAVFGADAAMDVFIRPRGTLALSL